VPGRKQRAILTPPELRSVGLDRGKAQETPLPFKRNFEGGGRRFPSEGNHSRKGCSVRRRLRTRPLPAQDLAPRAKRARRPLCGNPRQDGKRPHALAPAARRRSARIAFFWTLTFSVGVQKNSREFARAQMRGTISNDRALCASDTHNPGQIRGRKSTFKSNKKPFDVRASKC